jgi:hypothetical protein
MAEDCSGPILKLPEACRPLVEGDGAPGLMKVPRSPADALNIVQLFVRGVRDFSNGGKTRSL